MDRKAEELEHEAQRYWAMAQQVRGVDSVARLVELMADFFEYRARQLRDEAQSRGQAVMD